MELYKKDSKGKLRVLKIVAIGDEIHQQSGLLYGKLKLVVSKCVGKNVGRANETTAEEQAALEAEAKIKLKLKKDYFTTVEEASNTDIVLPMLAKDAKTQLGKIQYPCFVQPKLDGMRALGNRHGLSSRQGNSIDTLGHIVKDLSNIGDLLDGELYAHGKTFQDNMSRIKKYKEGLTEEVKYHVYDMAIENMGFKARYTLLETLSKTLTQVELVPTYQADSLEDIKKYHSHFISEGYEGTIIRWGDTPYKFNGRSAKLLKYKDFIDEVAEIIDIVPMEKRPEQGKAICRLKDGGEFTANFKMPFEKREEILTNKSEYIGQTAEIRFFEYTDSGLPRFPVCYGFRLDK